MMQKVWHDYGWQDYIYWQNEDKKTLKKINKLIEDIERNGIAKGKGKPEQLSGDMSGWWSRRIDDKNRIVYRIKDGKIEIIQCRGHYSDH